MKPKNNILLIGIIAAYLVCVGDFVVSFYLGTQYSGYNPLKQSISFLGQEGSPLRETIKYWGICFSFLFALFAYAFYVAYKSKGIWGKLGALCILIYGLGEGMGSGFFPINPIGTPTTLNAQLHDIFGGTGDAGLLLFPFVMLKIFSKESELWMYRLSYITPIVGLSVCTFFLCSKYLHIEEGWISYRGLWQRIYLAIYYTYLLIVAIKIIVPSLSRPVRSASSNRQVR